MNEADNDRRIKEVVMDWLVTSEDTVSGPMRHYAKHYIETGEAKVKQLQLQVDALKELHANDLKWAMDKNAVLILALQRISRFNHESAEVAKEALSVGNSKTERLIQIERRLGAEVRCDCGVPGCNKLYDHRK